MRILLTTTHLNPGGVSRYILTLSKGLSQKGHLVWVACCKDSQWLAELKKQNTPYVIIPIHTKSICSLKIIFSLFILLKFVRKEKIDIIHANTRVTQYLGFLINKLTGIPYISAFHGFYRKSRTRKLLKFEGKLSIAVSESVAKHAVDDLKIEKNKIRVVYNGVSKDDFSAATSNKTNYGFKQDDFVIGILGRISEEKGHFLAIEAFKLLSYQYNNIYLAISGKGKLEQELKTFIRLADLENKVKFFDVEAKKFLEIPDILIVPSKKEGFGYAIIEAFIKEVPVIGFNVGGIAEIIKDKQNGLLFYNYDGLYLKQAIEELMTNPDLRKKITQEAKKDADSFSMENMTLNTLKVYKELGK